MEKEIYLDNAATTKVHDSVVTEVNKYMTKIYANPSSIHDLGKKAKEDLENAREKIALSINAKPSEIYFTSGGTEANNLAIKGIAKANPNKKHIITSKIEHPAVLDTIKELENEGYIVDYINVNSEGLVDLTEIKNKIRDDTLLVSLMHANNEIGTIQPIKEIAQVCIENNIFFHSDAVQSFLKVLIDVEEIGVDLMSFSGHKVNAPKGIGFLFVKLGVNLKPIITGGGQEKNLRSGTENLPAIMGLAKAIELPRNLELMKSKRDKLLEEILKIPATKLNGSPINRSPNNIHVSFYGIEGESLMLLLNAENIFVSTGSACASNKLEESHVLKAIDVDEMHIHGSIRITIDEEITDSEIDFVAEKIKESVERLRNISPFKLKVSEKNGR